MTSNRRMPKSSAALRGLVGLAAAAAALVCFEAFVPMGVTAPKDGLAAQQRSAFGAAPEQPSLASSGSYVCGASMLAASAVMAAVIGKRSCLRAVRLQRPEGLTFREQREKGEQVLPLNRGLQRFFSVRNRQFWDYVVHPKVYFKRAWQAKDLGYAALFVIMHAGAIAAPWFFTWKAFATFLGMYFITGCLGITLSYHRQLAHRSFRSSKAVEYFLAYCGALALQSHPINWVSSHRHHHGATETERDVHSPLDGFWWAHMGWLMDKKGTWMRGDKNNASDLVQQPFYRFLQKTYALNAIVLPVALLYAWQGLPGVMWGFFFRVCWVWHVTWAVNSVSHCWGFKDWNTSCNSMNNWVIGILAFGEGWHNNHHAFEASSRHGLKWWQFDMTWLTCKFLEKIGLAWDLKYPSPSKMDKLTFPEQTRKNLDYSRLVPAEAATA